MSKHTPGPWSLWTQTDPDISEPSAHVALVSHVFVIGSGELGTPHSDARLIAAAPEMLEALKKAETLIKAFECPKGPPVESGDHPWNATLRSIRGALRKAEGR